MSKRQIVFLVVCAAVVVAGVVLGHDFFSGVAQLADPNPGA